MDPIVTGVPFGRRSPRKRGPYSTPIHRQGGRGGEDPVHFVDPIVILLESGAISRAPGSDAGRFHCAGDRYRRTGWWWCARL